MKKFLISILLMFPLFWCVNLGNGNQLINNDFRGNTINNISTENDKKEGNVIITTWNNLFWEFQINQDGLIYKNEKYGFQISYNKERSGWKIFDSKEFFVKSKNYYLIENLNIPFFIATMPSLSWNDFEIIQLIEFLTYEEYDNLKKSCTQSDILCDPSVEEITVWKNNKYYILLHQWFMRQFEELSNLFYPYLPLETITIKNNTEEGRTFTGSQYVLDNKFLFSDYKIFDV